MLSGLVIVNPFFQQDWRIKRILLIEGLKIVPRFFLHSEGSPGQIELEVYYVMLVDFKRFFKVLEGFIEEREVHETDSMIIIGP